MPLYIEEKDDDDVVHFIYGNSAIPEYPVMPLVQPEPVMSWSAYEAHMPQYPVVQPHFDYNGLLLPSDVHPEFANNVAAANDFWGQTLTTRTDESSDKLRQGMKLLDQAWNAPLTQQSPATKQASASQKKAPAKKPSLANANERPVKPMTKANLQSLWQQSNL